MVSCLKQLPVKHREIVKQRYYHEQSIEVLSSQFNRTVAATYRLLSRVRQVLHECICQRLEEGARNS